MRTIFVISDTHFNHTNILSFKADGHSIRTFNDAEEMNECMIENWNKVVKDHDIVYHLGNVYFNKKKPMLIDQILYRLKGKKRLILGNHDNGKDKLLLWHFKKIMMWREFSEDGLLLTHVPVHPCVLKESRFTGNKMVNVHGHTHSSHTNDISSGATYYNACVEAINYTPIAIEEIKQHVGLN